MTPLTPLLFFSNLHTAMAQCYRYALVLAIKLETSGCSLHAVIFRICTFVLEKVDPSLGIKMVGNIGMSYVYT